MDGLILFVNIFNVSWHYQMYLCIDRTGESGQGNYVTAGEMASGSTEMCCCSEFYVISNYVIKVNLLYKSMLVGGEL